jgi:multisubunit Na+/H+ antiporter MnhE subunit
MASFMVNLGVALIWLFLGEGTLAGFFVGWLVGFLLLALFRPVMKSDHYIRRSLGAVLFLKIFTWEFIKSNLVIARAALTLRVRDMHPDFVFYDVEGLTPVEIFLLGESITLTPGTTAVELINDGKTMVIHAFDASDPEAVCAGIDETLKRGILGFTR